MNRGTTETSVNSLIAEFRGGNIEAAKQLIEILYPELRRLAASKISGDHTWNPTSLVHELYLELMKIKQLRWAEDNEDERAAFLRFSSFMMTRLLMHHDRRLYRRAKKLEMREDLALKTPGAITLLHLEQTLERLAAVDSRLRTVVDLKVFVGLTGDEIAAQMGCSRRTVNTYWSFARHWLQAEFEGTARDGR